VTDLIQGQAEAHALSHTTPFEAATAEAAEWTRANMGGRAAMMAGLAEARLLELLVAVSGATHVLEIGSFTGIGALSLAEALPPGGTVTTIEVDEENAELARRHIAASDLAPRINLIVGDAREIIASLDGPFDLVWIDAWKPDYPAYYRAVVEKLSPRGVIAADNLFRGGGALDPESTDPGDRAMREFAQLVQNDERMHNVLLTIGDGVLLAWRRPAPR
jgi:predicted O-methyltransferase YrrM